MQGLVSSCLVGILHILYASEFIDMLFDAAGRFIVIIKGNACSSNDNC